MRIAGKEGRGKGEEVNRKAQNGVTGDIDTSHSPFRLSKLKLKLIFGVQVQSSS
jgi:hypothetical protein